MSMETELVDLLVADATIDETVDGRIYPVALRQVTTFPAITYGRAAGGAREYALDASVTHITVLMFVRCWAETYPAARTLADLCAAALDRSTTAQVDVITVRDGPDDWLDGADVFGCSLEVQMEQMP
jgi:hypothetical protein